MLNSEMFSIGPPHANPGKRPVRSRNRFKRVSRLDAEFLQKDDWRGKK
jgi:hypothetical protein